MTILAKFPLYNSYFSTLHKEKSKEKSTGANVSTAYR